MRQHQSWGATGQTSVKSRRKTQQRQGKSGKFHFGDNGKALLEAITVEHGRRIMPVQEIGQQLQVKSQEVGLGIRNITNVIAIDAIIIAIDTSTMYDIVTIIPCSTCLTCNS
jgi:hypothetical protein